MGNCGSRKKVWVKKTEPIEDSGLDVTNYHTGDYFKPRLHSENSVVKSEVFIPTEEVYKHVPDVEDVKDIPYSPDVDIPIPDIDIYEKINDKSWEHEMGTIKEETYLEINTNCGLYDSDSQSANDGEVVIKNRLAVFDSDSMSPLRKKPYINNWYNEDGYFTDFAKSLKSFINNSPSSHVGSPTE